MYRLAEKAPEQRHWNEEKRSVWRSEAPEQRGEKMMRLFGMELKKIMLSLVFAVFLVALWVMLNSQGAMNFSGEKLEAPVEGQEDYGIKTVHDPQVIMENALSELYEDYLFNMYVAYPVGFYKEVKLNEKKRAEMAEILEELTGISAEKLNKQTEEQRSRIENGDSGGGNMAGYVIEAAAPDQGGTIVMESEAAEEEEIWPALKPGLEYQEFVSLMERADELIGGGSNYRTDNLDHFSRAPVTYEEARQAYQLTKEQDRFTGGYARLFCDYAIVGVLSVMPVFLSVILFLKDKRARMESLLYIRKVSSLRLVLVRYSALISAMMLPVLVLDYKSNSTVWGMYPGEQLDYLAPLYYVIIWLLPTVLAVTAVGMFFTVLTGTPIAIAIQGIWWFYDINQGIWEENGCALWRLAPRHNTHVRTQEWLDHMGKFTANRIFFTVLALILVTATVFVYERKRRGMLYGKK